MSGPFLFDKELGCPYCGELISITIDTSAGSQRYIEDCSVCCRPIEFATHVDQAGDLVNLEVSRDDE